MIFVSTGGRNDRPAYVTASEFVRAGIRGIELSGGRPDPQLEPNLLEVARSAVLQVHNYFPPPEVPFVLNLASSDSGIAAASDRHVRRAVALAVLLGRPCYSFHAGFLIDPPVAELGHRILRREVHPRDGAIEAFVARVRELAAWAGTLGAELLIENNVLSSQNCEEFGGNPLLMTEATEIDTIMKRMPSNVGLLIDVAHLRVSARTLGLDPVSEHDKVRHWIRAYHLSDNDGTADTNDPVHDDSWFWPVIRRDLDYYTLEVYRTDAALLVEQVRMTERRLGKGSRHDRR